MIVPELRPKKSVCLNKLFFGKIFFSFFQMILFLKYFIALFYEIYFKTSKLYVGFCFYYVCFFTAKLLKEFWLFLFCEKQHQSKCSQQIVWGVNICHPCITSVLSPNFHISSAKHNSWEETTLGSFETLNRFGIIIVQKIYISLC